MKRSRRRNKNNSSDRRVVLAEHNETGGPAEESKATVEANRSAKGCTNDNFQVTRPRKVSQGRLAIDKAAKSQLQSLLLSNNKYNAEGENAANVGSYSKNVKRDRENAVRSAGWNELRPLQDNLFNRLQQPNKPFQNASSKGLLNAVMNRVSKSFDSKLYKLPQPLYILDKHEWLCIYSLVWPKPLNFLGRAFDKNGAAQSSAVKALQWLYDNGCISAKGALKIENDEKKSPEELYTDCRKVLVGAQTAKELIEKRVRSTKQQKIRGIGAVRSLSTSALRLSRSTVKEEAVNETKTRIDDSSLSAETRSLFPAPKNALHSCFQIVSQELQNRDIVLTPHYTPTKLKSLVIWNCTYSLKWPEPIRFTSTANTKQDASHKAAVSALTWLLKNKKITKEGRPLIYDKQELSKMTKQYYPVLALDQVDESKINEIVDLYTNRLEKELEVGEEDVADTESAAELLDEKWPAVDTVNVPKRPSVVPYLAREPVKLPISGYKNKIIDYVKENRVLIIKGEPGCGKSTRVPQYVLEGWASDDASPNGPCRIVVTQPRRLAAISLAERVASERREGVGGTVGFHVRLKSNFNKRFGRIMYCTTGILLRRLQSDPKLLDCSHIILDEAHERDVSTDLVMNLVRHALELNPNLKILIMSATMDTKVFQDYFNGAPVLNIPGFTYPVEEHFLSKDSSSYAKTKQMCAGRMPTVVHDDVVKLIRHIHKSKAEGAILCFLPGWDDMTKVKNMIPDRNDLYVMRLHSRMQIADQEKIFSRPPPGVRKIILATNIAETSITVDDVVYVIDTGIHKEERFEVEKGVNSIDNHWISKASAIQRKGRAGRCQPGESFHLYTKDKFEELEEYAVPEILRTSLTKIVLDSKVYSNNMNAVEFLKQLVCPPDNGAIKRAVQELKELELLDEGENLTPLGRTLSEFQLPPKLSKAMVNSVIFKCVTPLTDIATLFSAETGIFSNSLTSAADTKEVKSKFSKSSDHLAMMRILEYWLAFYEEGNQRAADKFCKDAGLIDYKLSTLQKLRDIHTDYLHKGLKKAFPLSDDFSDNDELVKAVLLSGVDSLLQYRTWDMVKGLLKKTNVILTKGNQKATITSESVNSRRKKFPSNFMVNINETISNLRHTTLVRETSLIPALSVLLFKNGKLIIENVSTDANANDEVLLSLQGTKIKFTCDRCQALLLKKCKESLQACVQYYIYQLTKGGECNKKVDLYWNEILEKLCQLLNKHGIKDD